MSGPCVKWKTADFIAGYVYRAIEYIAANNTNCFLSVPSDGFASDVCFPKVWVGGKHNEDVENASFGIKMEDVMQQLTDAFVAAYGQHFQLLASWEEYALGRANIVINYRILTRGPRKMTVSEIEKALGYRIEIVREDH